MTGLKFTFLICALIAVVAASPSGAPTAACSTMTPNHGFIAQGGGAPFLTQPLMSTMLANTMIPVSFNSLSSYPFKGFLAMAFDYYAQDGEPIGSFTVTKDARTISCFNGTQNAVTHVTNDYKTMVVVNWVPPHGFTGQVVFKVTYVKDFSTFWVKTTSSILDIQYGIPVSGASHVWPGFAILISYLATLMM